MAPHTIITYSFVYTYLRIERLLLDTKRDEEKTLPSFLTHVFLNRISRTGH